MRFDPASGEMVDTATGELAPEPASDAYPDPLEELDGEDPAPGPALDFELFARDAAELVSEELGRKVSQTQFRRMVMASDAPAPSSGTDGNPRWSQSDLEAWLAEKKPVTTPATTSASGLDFELFARDAAELVGEQLGYRLTQSEFRQLVMDGEAPAPTSGTDGNARWSQAALAAWISEKREADAAAAGDDSSDGAKDEPKPVHEDVYDFYGRTFSLYYELHDTTSNAMTREKPIMSWCQKWWLHRGVVGRLTAAWYAWEVAHAEGGSAISAWILEHADRHFDRIMAEDGPLRMCKSDHSDALDVYPAEPVPEPLRLKDNEEKGEQQ